MRTKNADKHTVISRSLDISRIPQQNILFSCKPNYMARDEVGEHQVSCLATVRSATVGALALVGTVLLLFRSSHSPVSYACLTNFFGTLFLSFFTT